MTPTQQSIWEQEKDTSLFGNLVVEEPAEPVTPLPEGDLQDHQETEPCSTHSSSRS